MNIPLIWLLWQHIVYLCVRCSWCREVCGLHITHTVMFSHDIGWYLIVLFQTQWRLETYVSIDLWMCSLRHLLWRQHESGQFHYFRSSFLNIGYRNIWVGNEGFQISNFSSARHLITFVMIYTATCFVQ